MIQILIVDDSRHVRLQLRKLVERNVDWEVCGEAVDGREAISKVRESAPDLILLDYRLPVMNGLQTAREIRTFAPNIKMLLCSMHVSFYLADEARKAGMHGAVSKVEDRLIVNAIETLLRHETFFYST